MSNSSTWRIEWTLSEASTPVQSGPVSNDNEGVFRIPQISSIAETLPWDCLVSYQDTRWKWERSYTSTEILSVYPIAPAD